MKKIILAIFMTFITLEASEVIKVTKVPGNVSNVGTHSRAWLSAKYYDIWLYPQTSIKMNDMEANELNAKNKAMLAKVKALYDGKNIAFLITWRDDSQNVQEGYNSSYADGFAMQFSTIVDAKKLPYIGMGSKGREVLVHLKKATGLIYEPNGNGDVYIQVNKANQNIFDENLTLYDEEVKKQGNANYAKAFISEGFRSMSEIKDNSSNALMDMSYKKGVWKGTMARSLKDGYLDLKEGVIPVAFAIWNGEKKNRDGIKHISGWLPVKFSGKNGGKELISELTSLTNGNIKNGEKLVMENCAACHHYKDVNLAPKFMAPNLSNIGGYSNEAYLMESLTHPSAVVVAGFNRNAHKNFAWYNVGEKGKRTSTMPPYDWMGKQSLQDIVAFLKTLKVEGKK